MAELSASAPPAGIRTRDQLAAIAFARISLLRNSLRTTRGALEVVSQVWAFFWFAALGAGGAAGFGVLGWYFAAHGQARELALPLWLLSAFWQIFPLAATAFTDTPDTGFLARFPLRYPAYFLIRLAFGAVDVATLVGTLCLLGFTIGAAIASPTLLPWAAAGAALLWAANVLIEQMIFAWLERWLARRRTREILALLFFLAVFSINFIGPLFRAGRGYGAAWPAHWLPLAGAITRWLPPSLPAAALGAAWPGALAALLALAAWAGAAGWLLHRRYVAAYRGELLEDSAAAPRPAAARTEPSEAGRRWRTPPFGAPGAVAQKELRVLSRSPMMFFPLAMPVLLLLLFRMRAFGAGAHQGGQVRLAVAGFGFPLGVAYALLVLTNLIYNALGTEGAGVQFYFVSPAAMRQVFLGKNLAYALVIAGEAVVIYLAVLFTNGAPSALIDLLTVAGLGFAVLCDFACGNLLSLYLPKKLDLTRLGRQNRGTTGLAALALQAVIGGVVALAVLIAVLLHRLWMAAVLLFALTLAAGAIYVAVLQQLDRIALSRRETLIAELAKP
jgi:ABC-2 type transport system permease protein